MKRSLFAVVSSVELLRAALQVPGRMRELNDWREAQEEAGARQE